MEHTGIFFIVLSFQLIFFSVIVFKSLSEKQKHNKYDNLKHRKPKHPSQSNHRFSPFKAYQNNYKYKIDYICRNHPICHSIHPYSAKSLLYIVHSLSQKILFVHIINRLFVIFLIYVLTNIMLNSIINL